MSISLTQLTSSDTKWSCNVENLDISDVLADRRNSNCSYDVCAAVFQLSYANLINLCAEFLFLAAHLRDCYHYISSFQFELFGHAPYD